MHKLVSLCVLLLLTVLIPVLAAEEVALFDGESLEGWNVYLEDSSVSMEEVWSVQDGLLVCTGEPLGYLYTEEEYEDFELVVEWRWAPGKEPGNSGVLMRINGEPKPIPRSIEAQLRAGDAGNVYAFHGMEIDGAPERTSRTQNHELLGDFVGIDRMKSAEHEPGEWNRYLIRLEGDDLSVEVNGERVNEAEDCESIAGPIGLQSEGGEIHFRKVVLRPLH